MVVHPWNPRAQDDWESKASMDYVVKPYEGPGWKEEKEREETEGEIRTTVSLQNHYPGHRKVRIWVVPTATSFNCVP